MASDENVKVYADALASPPAIKMEYGLLMLVGVNVFAFTHTVIEKPVDGIYRWLFAATLI